MPDKTQLTALIVMGVSGSGKSTIASALAEKLGWRFADGDQFHPPANVAKMSAGQPLDDADRWPWLQAIADEIDRVADSGGQIVIACSALKRAYRELLVHGRDDVILVHLDGSDALIAARMKQRRDHFMPPGLLKSQFATLQPPAPDEHVLVAPIDRSVASIVAAIVERLPAAQRSRAP
jgi:gluconokinase